MTQEEIILEHLVKYGNITSFEAFEEYGITRLSAKIFNLRKQGLIIESKPITKKNRYGSWVTFAEYVWSEENER